MKAVPRGSDTRSAVRSLTAAVHKLSEQIQAQRRDFDALRRRVIPTHDGWSLPSPVDVEMSDPVKERISAIEDRLSVERGQR